MRQSLQTMNSRLDLVLTPPYPHTNTDRQVWIPSGSVTFPAPVMQRWCPPAWIPCNSDNGFWLAPHVICYQRGYFPNDLYDQYMKAASASFNKSEQCERESMDQLPFDFLVAITTHDNQFTAGCAVELRPSKSLANDPYLYISTLCTDPRFRSKGLAHQLIHAVYTLGAIMLEQNEKAPGIWNRAIPDRHLYLGLTVAKTPGSDTATRLVHQYSQCGLSTHRQEHVEYDSFTPYSVYEWQLEKTSNQKIPMWQSVSPDVLYEDDRVCILSPQGTHAGSTCMYHPFPIEHTKSVYARGIVHPKHRFLYGNASDIYTPDEIRFTEANPSAQGAFCIRVKSKTAPFVLRISVPAWFAVTKHGVMA